MRWRHAGRVRAIARVLARHGLTPYLRQLGLPVPRGRRQAAVPGGWPEQLRAALVELGPTFVKLGQLLAARSDLIPAEYAAALQTLRDEVEPVPAEEVRREVAATLGRPLDSVFAAFAEQPLAAASIGQVHAARLRDGTDVLVKVRRPGIAAAVRADFELFADLVPLVERRLPAAREWQISTLLEEFRRNFLRELDLRRELRHMALFARAYGGVEGIRVPRAHPHLCSERLLVMERLPGEPVSRSRPEGERGRLLAARLVGFFLLQVFERGFFHADLHPGNVLVLPDGLGILDFGQVGWLDEEARAALVSLLVAFEGRDYGALADGLLAVATPRDGGWAPDPSELRRDLMEVVELHDPQRLSELELRPLLADVAALARRHHLRLPRSYALLFKAAAAVEGTVRLLDPDIGPNAVAAGYAADLLRRRLEPERVLHLARRNVRELGALARESPRRVRSILRKVEEGTLAVEFRHAGLQPVIDRLGRIGTRLSAALIVAALIVGASLVVQSNRGPKLFDVPVLAWVGYGAAAAVGAWLLWADGRGRGPR